MPRTLLIKCKNADAGNPEFISTQRKMSIDGVAPPPANVDPGCRLLRTIQLAPAGRVQTATRLPLRGGLPPETVC